MNDISELLLDLVVVMLAIYIVFSSLGFVAGMFEQSSHNTKNKVEFCFNNNYEVAVPTTLLGCWLMKKRGD